MFPPVAAATGSGRNTSPPAAPAARAPANRSRSRRLVGFRLPFDSPPSESSRSTSNDWSRALSSMTFWRRPVISSTSAASLEPFLFFTSPSSFSRGLSTGPSSPCVPSRWFWGFAQPSRCDRRAERLRHSRAGHAPTLVAEHETSSFRPWVSSFEVRRSGSGLGRCFNRRCLPWPPPLCPRILGAGFCKVHTRRDSGFTAQVYVTLGNKSASERDWGSPGSGRCTKERARGDNGLPGKGESRGGNW